MPELKEMFAGILMGATNAIEASERAHLQAHVEAVQALGGKPDATLDDLLAAFAKGWLPDYFAGDALEVAAQLTMSTARDRSVSGSGGVTLGPVQIQAQVSERFTQGTETNLSINAKLARQSRSAGLQYALQQLGPVGAPSEAPATVK